MKPHYLFRAFALCVIGAFSCATCRVSRQVSIVLQPAIWVCLFTFVCVNTSGVTSRAIMRTSNATIYQLISTLKHSTVCPLSFVKKAKLRCIYGNIIRERLYYLVCYTLIFFIWIWDKGLDLSNTGKLVDFFLS